MTSSTSTSMLKSTSAKKITTKNNVYSNISAVNNMKSDNEELFLDNNFFQSTTLLIDSDILKSIIKLLGTCPNSRNNILLILNVINQKRKDYHFC